MPIQTVEWKSEVKKSAFTNSFAINKDTVLRTLLNRHRGSNQKANQNNLHIIQENQEILLIPANRFWIHAPFQKKLVHPSFWSKNSEIQPPGEYEKMENETKHRSHHFFRGIPLIDLSRSTLLPQHWKEMWHSREKNSYNQLFPHITVRENPQDRQNFWINSTALWIFSNRYCWTPYISFANSVFNVMASQCGAPGLSSSVWNSVNVGMKLFEGRNDFSAPWNRPNHILLLCVYNMSFQVN